jgi:hypothetical protein
LLRRRLFLETLILLFHICEKIFTEFFGVLHLTRVRTARPMLVQALGTPRR